MRWSRTWTTRVLAAALGLFLWTGARAVAVAERGEAGETEVLPAEGDPELCAWVGEALRTLTESTLRRRTGFMPEGTVLERAEWVDGRVEIDLTLPTEAGGREFSMLEVEEVVRSLAAAVPPTLDFGGVRVQARFGTERPYRLLEDFVPGVGSGDYAPAEETAQTETLPRSGRAEPAEAEWPATLGGTPRLQPSGALSGVIVFTTAGHGWVAGTSSWYLGRGLLYELNEDYGNLEQLNYFVQYLFNAGATVVPFRPMGYQNYEVVLDQDDPEVTYTGSWINSSSSPYYENGRTVSGVPYRYASVSVTETATARYQPDLPAGGFYPVYTWVLDSSNRVNQLYHIVHSGGTAEIRVDHRLVGKGWVGLGTYHFNAGTSGYVEISNRSTLTGYAIADAIRFGNGWGDVVGAGPGTVSGYPRDEECQRYWAESETQINAVGLPTSIYDCCTSDEDDNVGTAARWAREMNNTSVNNNRWQRVYLEFHSNATGCPTPPCAGRGTVALVTGNATTYQTELATILGDEVEADMQILDDGFEYPWASRANPYSGTFGAISTTNNSNEFDATILEVAFHDNDQDARLLLDPKVRDAVARSSLHGLIKFLNSLPGSTIPLAFPPMPPRQVQAVQDGAGGVVLSWTTPLTGEAYGDAATGYRVYRSPNGFGFDGGQDVGNVLSVTLGDVPVGTTTYLRIAAYNAGGESLPSEVLAVRRPQYGGGTWLIVNGFDRVSRGQDYAHTIPLGTQKRPIQRRVNSFDYVIQHALALAAGGASFDSCSNEAVSAGAVDLNDYRAVVWILGEESTADHTFDATEQSLMTPYLNGGGKLFVSGAEIGWDLDYGNNGRLFYNNYLKADYVADGAGTRTVTAAAGSIFAGISSFTFDDGTYLYNVDWPDVLATYSGSMAALNYSGGSGGVAGIVYDGVFQVVNFGFPFETVISSTTRAQLMDRVIGFFFNDPFDSDRDGDVDLTDLADFVGCLQGPNVDYAAGDPCQVHDDNADQDVDLADFRAFQAACTGP